MTKTGILGKKEYIFSIEPQDANIYCIPADQCELGKCVQTSQGLVWGLKRYTDDQIVLQGCGDDEYFYNREEKRAEIFCKND